MNKAAVAGIIAAVAIVIIIVSVVSYGNIITNEGDKSGQIEDIGVNTTGKHYSVDLQEEVGITSP